MRNSRCVAGEDGCNGVCSNNEDEADGDRDSASPLNNSSATTSYARASSQQRTSRTKATSTSSRGSSYSYRHRSYYQQQPANSNQPLVTTEKKTFNEGLSTCYLCSECVWDQKLIKWSRMGLITANKICRKSRNQETTWETGGVGRRILLKWILKK
jgi:hypothetical protein